MKHQKTFIFAWKVAVSGTLILIHYGIVYKQEDNFWMFLFLKLRVSRARVSIFELQF